MPYIYFYLLYRGLRLAFYIKRDGKKVGATCGTNEGEETAYRLLVGKLEGKRPLRRTRRRWVDNIKMDINRDRMG
jgi:hypothetical protein